MASLFLATTTPSVSGSVSDVMSIVKNKNKNV